MRTKILLIMTLLSFTFGSCDRESDTFADNSESSINLTAPNGQKIAANIDALINLVAGVIEEKYGENKEIKIDNVIYHSANYGFIAEVRYKTYDGHSSNLIMSNIKLDGELDMRKIKTKRECEEVEELTIYSCKNEDRNKCPDCEIGKTENGVKCFCSKGDRSFCTLEKKQK